MLCNAVYLLSKQVDYYQDTSWFLLSKQTDSY